MFRLVIFLIVYLPIVKIRNVQGLVVVLLPTRSWSLVALWRVKFHTLKLLGKWASWDMSSTNIMYHTKHQVTCPWVCTYFKLFLKFSYICVGTFVNSHQYIFKLEIIFQFVQTRYRLDSSCPSTGVSRHNNCAISAHSAGIQIFKLHT